MTMTLTEGMKTLNVILKRIASNCSEIQLYSSKLNIEKPAFESENAQKKEIESRIQANIDLEKEYRRIKRCIDYTNLMTKVELDGITYTISDLLVMKRNTGKLITNTYSCLNDNNGAMRLRTYAGLNSASNEKMVIEKLYDEKEKNTQLRKWQDLIDNIESRLETINATTELIESF